MDKLTGWVYCSDRLPSPDHLCKFEDGSSSWTESKSCMVGVLNKDFSRQLGFGTYCRSVNGEEYWSGTTEDGEDLYKMNVVAWMPLPRLPDPPLKEDA